VSGKNTLNDLQLRRKEVKQFTRVTVGIMFLSLAAGVLAQRPTQSFDPLRGLKRALAEAGALALTTTQEEQLKTLMQTYRDSLPDGPSDAMEAARDAYQAAILAGDLATANAQAAVIANLQTAALTARLQTEAKFKLDVIAILRTNGDQAAMLRQKLGDEGFLRIISSLAGRGRGGHLGGEQGGRVVGGRSGGTR
jgi:Spy/CpxP family protein refolding chaperone